MIYAQIMAGGIGKRMGNTPLPKQFLKLGDKPIIIHTVEKFILNDKFDLILISTPEEYIEFTQDTLNKCNIKDDRIRAIAGGPERNDTLENAIKYIENTNGLKNDDAIVVHDAVRPFITKKIIDENIKALRKFKSVDTVVPAYDTIVFGDGNEVSRIPIRDEMFIGQTPQSFNIKTFQESFKKLSEEDKKTLSDSVKIVLLSGEKIGMVEGSHSNIKITTPYDLDIANAIIKVGH